MERYIDYISTLFHSKLGGNSDNIFYFQTREQRWKIMGSPKRGKYYLYVLTGIVMGRQISICKLSTLATRNVRVNGQAGHLMVSDLRRPLTSAISCESSLMAFKEGIDSFLGDDIMLRAETNGKASQSFRILVIFELGCEVVGNLPPRIN